MEFANTQQAIDELHYKKRRLALNNQMINLIKNHRSKTKQFAVTMRKHYNSISNEALIKTRAFIDDLSKNISKLRSENKIVQSEIKQIKDWIERNGGE